MQNIPLTPLLWRPFLLFFLPLCVLVLVAAGFYGHVATERELTRLRSEESYHTALGAGALAHHLETINRDLRFIVGHNELRMTLNAPTQNNLEHLTQHFVNFSRAYGIYDQLRWIDETGMERIRVDYHRTAPIAVTADKLQNKGQRYFFTDSLKLHAGETFVSPLDLNIEHEQIEVPHKPMLRVATPVFDDRGRKRGIVILNYYGRILLDAFAQATAGIADHAMLLNSEGYWLKSPNPEEEWGFMFKRAQHSLPVRSPAAWARIRVSDSGQEEQADGLWTWQTVYPLLAGQISSSGTAEAHASSRSMVEMREYRWKVVTHVSSNTLSSIRANTWFRLAGITAFLLGLLGFGSWKLARSREKLHSVIDSALDAVITINSAGVITGWNLQASRIFGWPREEALGRLLHQTIIPPAYREAHLAGIRRFLETGFASFLNSRVEVTALRRDGQEFPIELSIIAIKVVGTYEFSAFIRDISERKKAEAEIRELAFYDTLTKLPNRRFFLERLQQAAARIVRTGQRGAVLLVDLDNFKNINATQSHASGDLLLIETARRLQACVAEGDTVARLGGDEFIILLENLPADEPAAATQAEATGERILTAIKEPVSINARDYNHSASIGLVLFSSEDQTATEILKHADIALHCAKEEGRGGTQRFFDPTLQAQVIARVALEFDLRRAIPLRQLVLYYQPQVDATGRLVGAEALVRWQHPERGMVPPAEFIPVAEETGLMLSLGHWILAVACQQLATWAMRPQTAHLTLSVNVSAQQFRQSSFPEEVLSLVERYQVNPGKLKLEITESLLLDNVEEVIATMDALRVRGINFSMDDFGTGYSSLSYLKRLPLQQLKIDQSFVRDVLTDANDAAIVQTVIMLGQHLGLSVLAEGVETLEQKSFLAAHGCHNYQGYLFGKPVPADEFEQLVTPVS